MSTQRQNDMLGQAYIAFGQGSGNFHISRQTAEALREHFLPMGRPEVIAMWDEIAAQALERVRAMGRLAALYAGDEASPVISPRHFLRAAGEVADKSGTEVCGDQEPVGLSMPHHMHQATAH